VSWQFWVTTLLIVILNTILMVLCIKRTLYTLRDRHPDWELEVLPPDGIFFWIKFGIAMSIPFLGALYCIAFIFGSNIIFDVAVRRIENRIELELIAEQYRAAHSKVLCPHNEKKEA